MQTKRSYATIVRAGMLWTLLRRFGIETIGLPTAMVLARLVTPADFGVAAAGRIFFALAGRLGEFGLPTALVRLTTLRPEHMSSVLAVGLGMGAATWLLLAVSAPAIGAFFDSAAVAQVLPVAALAFLVTPWGSTAQVALARDMRYRRMTAAVWVGVGAQSIVSIVLAWRGFGFWSLVLGHLARDVVDSTAKVVLSGWRPSIRFSSAAFRDVWSYGLGIQSKKVMEYLGNSVDSLVVGRVLGLGALGLYDKAFDSVQRLTGRIAPGQTVTFRVLAIIRDDPDRLRKAYATLTLATSLLASPVLLGCIAVAPQLFLVLFGPAWEEAVTPFRILCGAALLKVVSGPAVTTNEVVGYLGRQVVQRAVYVGLVLVGVLVGSRFGIAGAAWGVLGAGLLLAVMLHALLAHATGIRVRTMLAAIGPGWLTGIVVALAALAVEAGLARVGMRPDALVLLVAQGVVGAAVYLGLVLYSPFAAVRAVAADSMKDLWPALAKRLSLA